METVLISKANYEVIKKTLDVIREEVSKINSPSEHFIGTEEFIKLMKISPRTAQVWRDEGRIGFSQQGKKIYYRMSDIDRFLDVHYKKPFSKGYESV